MRALAILGGLIAAFMFAGCSKDDNPTAPVADPVADFTWSGGTVTPASVTFVNRSENADRFYWDFGDGRTSIQEAPAMSFTTCGSFTVTLIATASATSKADTVRKTLSITPGKCYLDTIFVDQLPFTDGSGAGWDLASGPDLFFNLLDANGNTIASSTASSIADLAPNQLPVYWVSNGQSLQLTDWNGTLSFQLWDYDDTGNDLIGGVTFTINNLITSRGYVLSYQLQNGSVRMRISLNWQ